MIGVMPQKDKINYTQKYSNGVLFVTIRIVTLVIDNVNVGL